MRYCVVVCMCVCMCVFVWCIWDFEGLVGVVNVCYACMCVHVNVCMCVCVYVCLCNVFGDLRVR